MEIKGEEWPHIHTNNESYLRPYNGSIFTVHEHYKMVFPEKEFDKIDDDVVENKTNTSMMGSSGLVRLMEMTLFTKVDKSKIFKIKYDLNLIP
jgi:hypothetical protein